MTSFPRAWSPVLMSMYHFWISFKNKFLMTVILSDIDLTLVSNDNIYCSQRELVCV